jgi:hypothetical protein
MVGNHEKKGEVSICGCFFVGDPEGYGEEGSGDWYFSPWGPVVELGRLFVCRELM